MKLLTTLTGMEHAMGTRPPWYLGRAYYQPESDFVVLAPIPLNFLIGWCREAYYRLRRGPEGIDGLLETARIAGFRSGLDAGENRVVTAIQQWFKSGNTDYLYEVIDRSQKRRDAARDEERKP